MKQNNIETNFLDQVISFYNLSQYQKKLNISKETLRKKVKQHWNKLFTYKNCFWLFNKSNFNLTDQQIISILNGEKIQKPLVYRFNVFDSYDNYRSSIILPKCYAEKLNLYYKDYVKVVFQSVDGLTGECTVHLYKCDNKRMKPRNMNPLETQRYYSVLQDRRIEITWPLKLMVDLEAQN